MSPVYWETRLWFVKNYATKLPIFRWKCVYDVWAHATTPFFIQKVYISKLYLQPTCSNMFQNDNVTNDLIHGLVNDHGFEDTAISRVTTYFKTYLNNLEY